MMSKHNPDRLHRAGFQIPISTYFGGIVLLPYSTTTRESASPKSGTRVCVLMCNSYSILVNDIACLFTFALSKSSLLLLFS